MTPEIEEQKALSLERDALYFGILHIRRRMGELTGLLRSGQYTDAKYMAEGLESYTVIIIRTLEGDQDGEDTPQDELPFGGAPEEESLGTEPGDSSSSGIW